MRRIDLAHAARTQHNSAPGNQALDQDLGPELVVFVTVIPAVSRSASACTEQRSAIIGFLF